MAETSAASVMEGGVLTSLMEDARLLTTLKSVTPCPERWRKSSGLARPYRSVINSSWSKYLSPGIGLPAKAAYTRR